MINLLTRANYFYKKDKYISSFKWWHSTVESRKSLILAFGERNSRVQWIQWSVQKLISKDTNIKKNLRIHPQKNSARNQNWKKLCNYWIIYVLSGNFKEFLSVDLDMYLLYEGWIIDKKYWWSATVSFEIVFITGNNNVLLL